MLPAVREYYSTMHSVLSTTGIEYELRVVHQNSRYYSIVQRTSLVTSISSGYGYISHLELQITNDVIVVIVTLLYLGALYHFL